MLTKLLTPILVATAKSEPKNTVRVIWLSSVGAELESHQPGGVDVDNLDFHDAKPAVYRYNASKAGAYLQAAEFAKRHKDDGVVSVALNPGNCNSELGRDLGVVVLFFLSLLIVHPVFNGAYTDLFAAFAPEITAEIVGAWIVPWGRVKHIREDLLAATKSVEGGGNGVGLKFWEWNEEQIKEEIKV